VEVVRLPIAHGSASKLQQVFRQHLVLESALKFFCKFNIESSQFKITFTLWKLKSLSDFIINDVSYKTVVHCLITYIGNV
jgi:hypothetical protein